MAEHTPEPWQLDDDGSHSVVVYADEFRVFIAEVRISPSRVDECRANAHLIVAAPALLAACQEAHEFLCRPVGSGKSMSALVARLAEAIAKATGQD